MWTILLSSASKVGTWWINANYIFWELGLFTDYGFSTCSCQRQLDRSADGSCLPDWWQVWWWQVNGVRATMSWDRSQWIAQLITVSAMTRVPCHVEWSRRSAQASDSYIGTISSYWGYIIANYLRLCALCIVLCAVSGSLTSYVALSPCHVTQVIKSQLTENRKSQSTRLSVFKK